MLVALAEVDSLAVRPTEDLDLDVVWAREELLEVDRVVAEGALRLGPGRGERRSKVLRAIDTAHALAAAACDRLDEQRKADAARRRGRLVVVHRLGARHDGHARRDDRRARPGLVAHGLDRRGRRADPRETGSLDLTREAHVF